MFLSFSPPIYQKKRNVSLLPSPSTRFPILVKDVEHPTESSVEGEGKRETENTMETNLLHFT